MALDRELKRLEREKPPEFQFKDDAPELTVTEDERTMLSEFVADVKPADTMAELSEQVQLCKMHGASLEATDKIFRMIIGPNYPEPYFMYRDIKVYRIGASGDSQANDALTIEQKLFGKKADTKKA